MKSGLLITFEGTEGAGKSTLIREIQSRLHAQGLAVTLTREPGGSPVAEKIRKIILEEPMDPRAELFLYEAARAEHLSKTLTPALKRGNIVLCDRFTDSSLAYQAHARGLPWKEVQALNRLATQGLKPNLTILLDVDPAQGLKRAREKTRFEAEGVKFQKKVRLGFYKARAQDPKRWLVVQSNSGNPGVLADRIIVFLEKKFKIGKRKNG